jgi:hypothetical protein
MPFRSSESSFPKLEMEVNAGMFISHGAKEREEGVPTTRSFDANGAQIHSKKTHEIQVKNTNIESRDVPYCTLKP